MASASNRVEVDLEIGRDSLTPALGRIRGLAGEMRGVGNLGGSNFGSGFVGGLAASGVMMAVDALKTSIASIGQGIKEASDLQTSGIMSADSIARNLGTPFTKANEMLEGLRQDLSKAAAALPGEAKDYFAVMDRVSGAIAGIEKDPEKFKSATADISKRVGAISFSARVDGNESGSAIDRFLRGTTAFGELSQLDLFQKTELPAIMQRLASEKGLDLSKSKDWTGLQRLELIQAALNEGVSDNLLARLSNTFDSTVQSIVSAIFDPLTGILGMARQIKSMNMRSALDAANGALQSIWDLFNNIGVALGRLRISFDPMEGIIKFFDFIQDISNFFSALVLGEMDFNIDNISKNIEGWLGGMIDGLYNLIDKIPADKLGMAIGGLFWALIEAVFGLIPKLAGLFLKILEKTVTVMLFELIIAPLKFMGDQFANFIRGLVNPIVKPITDFFTAIKNLFDKATSLIPSIPGAQSVGSPGNAVNEAFKLVNPIYGVGSKIIDTVNPFKPKDTQPLPQPATSPPNASLPGTPFVANVSVSGSAQDAGAIATAVMDRINQAYGVYKQGALT